MIPSHNRRNCGQNRVPRVDENTARTKADFYPIISRPKLELSWLMPGVNLSQVTAARATAHPTICSCVTAASTMI